VLPTPGAGEILLIALLVLIVFFGEKVGALGDAIGKAREEFRRGKSEDDRIEVRRADPDAK
jgi:Sec-independent protein translocase protein TatA